jgi:hypothetical protein
MDIETGFRRIGARARLRRATTSRTWDWRRRRWERHEPAEPVAIDVIRVRHGELFDIAVREDTTIEVLDTDRPDRHLLLLARVDGMKSRYLCGHDERHWFVAAIPEATPVSTVEDAKLALRPNVFGRSARNRLVARRELELVRQGEWFFAPAPAFVPGRLEAIRRLEPISRGAGSTPHVAAEAVRRGGRVLWFPQISFASDSRHARGYGEAEMERLARSHAKWAWRSMLRDPELYVRGAIRHPDHATITLRGWHRVYMNTESLAQAGSHVVFLD